MRPSWRRSRAAPCSTAAGRCCLRAQKHAPAGHQPTQRTLQLTIAAADLSLEELEGLWLDSLDIFTIQRDDSALQAKIDAKTLRLRLHADTHARVLKDGVPFQASISLPAPGKSVRLIVVDGNSGRMGSLTLTGDDPALQ